MITNDFPQKLRSQIRPSYVAKMKVRSEKELKTLGRTKDGPVQLEPGDDDPPLETGKEYQVFLMARARCKCMIKVRESAKKVGANNLKIHESL